MSAGRILVVDDDPQIRRVMRATLAGQGYEVDDVTSGEAGLEKLRGKSAVFGRFPEPAVRVNGYAEILMAG